MRWPSTPASLTRPRNCVRRAALRLEHDRENWKSVFGQIMPTRTSYMEREWLSMGAHNIFAEMLERIRRVSDELASAGVLPPGLDLSPAAVEPPRDQTRGDMATNVAMVLAK